jgi:predicted transcriptional regulator
MAISELREMNLVHFSPKSESSRGRPAHIYRLRMSLEQSIQPFINLAKKRAKQIMDDIEVVQELVTDLESKEMNRFMVA